MMDDLAKVIGKALNEHAAQFHPTVSKVETIANAVRSYLLSEERVEAAAVGAVPEPTHLYNQGTRGTQYEADMKRAVAVERAVFIGRYRAAFTAAIGQPEAEFSGWVEVVEDDRA